MKVIFMGTPDFAAGILEAILAAGHEVLLVVTQPDKPKGRGGKMQPPPVKEVAVSAGLPVYQPTRIREAECVDFLKNYAPDVIVVAAFGQILPQEILDLPRICCMNIHASLLPRYRGAAPIQWAVLNGDEVTGVTAMRMDAGLDTGDMIAKKEVVVAQDETAGSLFDRLEHAGAELAVEVLARMEAGEELTFTPQDAALATHTKRITKDLGLINWARPAVEIERQIRGLNPWPSAYTYYNGKLFKIWKARVLDASDDSNAETAADGIHSAGFLPAGSEQSVSPGTVLCADKRGFVIQTGQGTLELLEVQPEGKKRMDAGAFLRGNPVAVGRLFTDILDEDA